MLKIGIRSRGFRSRDPEGGRSAAAAFVFGSNARGARRPGGRAHAGTNARTANYGFRTNMSGFFVQSSHMPCTECGASVPVIERETHSCDPRRLLEYRMFQLRDEVAGFDDGLRGYLDSPRGRFAQWLAERDRRSS